MLIVLYTRKRHGRHDRFDKGARTSTSADNDFQRNRERISNLQFRITLFVKIAVNLMLFFSDRRLTSQVSKDESRL